jgi:CHAD domain-containing protein
MAFRLRVRKPVGKEAVRVLREQLRCAEKVLTHPDESGDSAIHDARKALKKGRAALRLLARPLGRKRYRGGNRRLRTIARRLSSTRDAEARLEAMDRLIERGPEGRVLRSLRRALARRLDEQNGPQTAVVMGEAVDALRRFLVEVESWDLADARFGDLMPGAERTYRRGRKAFAAAYAEPSAETFHAWRKRVKDLWYHTRLLVEIWPPVMKARRRELKRLSELLGEDHDLALMASEVECARDLEPAARDALRRLLARESDELRRQARPLGLRLYAEKPDGYMRRLVGAWEAVEAGDLSR